jgi:hypothetical protein
MNEALRYPGVSRRQFVTGSAAIAAYSLLPGSAAFAATDKRGIGGVAVGAISYSFRELPTTAEKILEYLLATGLNTVELMGDAAEEYAGAPNGPGFGPPPGGEKSKWRKSAPMARYKTLRKLYNDAGVSIDILKLGEASWSDADIDYAYTVARILGARGISFELDNKAAQRLGTFATKHRMRNGMHNHGQYGEAGFTPDQALSYSSYNSLNLDVGHYVGSTGQSPIPFLKQYHSRITHLHLKDRKTPANGGANVAWGQGDTPLREVLQLLKRERYPISAMIELEYPVPAGSDVLTEVKKCVEYCKAALT